MSTCRVCGIELDETTAYPSTLKYGSKICKVCQLQEIKHRKRPKWKEFTEKQKSSHLKAKRKWRAKRIEELITIKGGRCERCGFNNETCLIFHHKEKKPKGESIMKIIKKGFPLEKLQLLCRNCHVIVHGKNRKELK